MAEGLDQVYDALLLDHIRSARNYGLQGDGAAVVELVNPLCGDTLQLQVELAGQRLAAVRFSCECCGIAMGNASLMTTIVTGATVAGARALADEALAVLAGRARGPAAGEAWALLRAVAGALPARRTCASLGWQALLAFLDGSGSGTARDIRG